MVAALVYKVARLQASYPPMSQAVRAATEITGAPRRWHRSGWLQPPSQMFSSFTSQSGSQPVSSRCPICDAEARMISAIASMLRDAQLGPLPRPQQVLAEVTGWQHSSDLGQSNVHRWVPETMLDCTDRVMPRYRASWQQWKQCHWLSAMCAESCTDKWRQGSERAIVVRTTQISSSRTP